VLLLVGVFAFFIFQRLRITKKQKLVIEEQKAVVEEQKAEVEEAHVELEEKNREVMDSINYAKRIQDALLATEEHQSKHLPEHFILFEPKDVVSGDFYWALEKQDHLYLTSADCTGHGVPGAFMSMLGIAFLNEINAHDKLLNPAEILDQLRDRIIKELGQDGGESKDGMDMSLIRLNLKTKELEWAGANNPLYHIKELDGKQTDKDVQNETHYIQIISPDKQPIAQYLDKKPFTNHSIKLNKGDGIVLFTDGFADQFGGSKGKKLMYKPFRRILLENMDKPMKTQKEVLTQVFKDWKGEVEQVDDVCVIGVRV